MSSDIDINNLFHILYPSWIHHIGTQNWILLSQQYAHLKVATKHCTKFQVSLIGHLDGEVIEHNLFHNLHSSSIPHNSKKNN